MRTFLVLLFALMAVTASMADICFPNICSYARCVQLREKDCAAKGADWHLIPFAGFCGCCSKCVKISKEGEYCMKDLGVPSSVPTDTICQMGLHCDVAKHVCTKNR
ncbi:hypothetical protein TYRP_013164 [Tyrophagus putrescentiae]|nr:hypothetical protein TYRP_013164 [Tyrophagus putrescentiae]